MRTVSRAISFAAAIILTLIVPGLSEEAGSGRWSTGAPLPQAMDEIGATAVDGKVYVIGGQTKEDPHSPLVEEYNPATNIWRTCAPLPEGLSHPGVTSMGGKIYVFGGFLTPVVSIVIDSLNAGSLD